MLIKKTLRIRATGTGYEVINLFSFTLRLGPTVSDVADNESSDEEYQRFVTGSKRKISKANVRTGKKAKGKTFQEEIICLQKAQMVAMKENEERNATFLKEILEAQRKSDIEERERDRQFMLTFGQLFANKQ